MAGAAQQCAHCCRTPAAAVGTVAAARAPPARPQRLRALRVRALHKGWSATHRAAASAAPAAAAPAQQLLIEPEAATIELLTRLRDPRDAAEALRPFLAPPAASSSASSGGGARSSSGSGADPALVMVAGVPVLEDGPLAGCAAFMDAAARRALPGHLLRRARVLSSLRVGPECLQRVAVTACSGEELTLSWRLRHVGLGGGGEGPAEDGSASSSGGGGAAAARAAGAGEDAAAEAHASSSSAASEASSSASSMSSAGSSPGSSPGGGPPAGGVRSAWQLVSVSRDASGDAELSPRPPPRPHPRLPPESVVLAQLAALRRGALHEAAAFAVWGRHAGSSGWDAQMAEFKALLRDPQLHLCLTHDEAQLGPGALPRGQRSFLQEVTLHSGRGGGARLLYRLNMHGDGCWLIRSFEAR